MEKIIPQEVLDIPELGALNIHGSLLPRHRGASPIHQALLEGDKETGITIMLMDEQVDHGPMLLQKSVMIADDDNFVTLELKLAHIAQDLIVQAIPEFAEGKLKPKEQDHSKATFTKIITKADGLIDWHKDVRKIYNKYRAYITWPGVHTVWKGMNLKINLCRPMEGQFQGQPGTVSRDNERILVVCGEGALELTTIQLEGKKALPVEEFVRGHQDFIGSKLG
jgi:methionyl-tRNA formyltransferase